MSSRPAKRNARERAQVSTAEAFHLIEDIAAMRVPLLALTGGDPLCRADLFPVIEFASRRSVRTSLTLLPTPKLDEDGHRGIERSWAHAGGALAARVNCRAA